MKRTLPNYKLTLNKQKKEEVPSCRGLAKAKKELASKDEQIGKLTNRIKTLMAEKSQLQEKHKAEIKQLHNEYQKEIDKAIQQAESAERKSKEKDSVIDRQNQRIDQLDRKANPHRYQLSSGAELVHHNIPNMRNPSIHIWTRVGNEEYCFMSLAYCIYFLLCHKILLNNQYFDSHYFTIF